MNDTHSAGARNRPDALSVRIDRKRFHIVSGGELEVLRDFAFDLAPHSFTCLIGPSGCGKTTLLRILLGLDEDFTGEIDRRFATSRVGVVFQEPWLLPWRTVEENVRLALPDDLTGQDLDTLFDEVGLADARDSYPGELSLGMARRAALARAFAIEPEIMVLDEPFVSLDEATASRLRDLLCKLWRGRPTTVLMVTHNLREAVTLAARILVLGPRPARLIEAVDVPSDLKARGSVAVERFLAELAGRLPGIVTP